MYTCKARFFDTQIHAPWASGPYGPEEMAKLDRLFSVAGSLEGMTIVEPGCGTGRLTEILAQRVGPLGRVIAMDISGTMVDAARERVAAYAQVTLHHGTLEAYPLPPGQVDLVLCHQVFPHLEAKERALRLLAKSLKEQGRLIISHFIPLHVINDVHRKAGRAVEADKMPSDREMRRLFMDAGLSIDFMSDNDERGYFLCGRLGATETTMQESDGVGQGEDVFEKKSAGGRL